MKYSIQFTQLIAHDIEVEAESLEEARAYADSQINEGLVEFTMDDIAMTDTEINAEVWQKEYSLKHLWELAHQNPKKVAYTKALCVALAETEDYAESHASKVGTVESIERYIDYSNWSGLKFNGEGRLV